MKMVDFTDVLDCVRMTVTLVFFISRCSASDVVNVALGKTAYETESRDGSQASFAVDGDLSQNFFTGSCTHTEGVTYNVQWEVDLGDCYVIHNVTIYNRQDCCDERLQEVELYIGGTRDQYALAAYKPGPAGSILTFEFDSHLQGRWVMITRAIPKDHLTLCEVLVMGSHIPVGSKYLHILSDVVNVALGKTAYETDSYTYSSIESQASFAVDGDLSQDFHDGSCTHTATYNVQWEVDLGDCYVIHNVTIYNRQDCCDERLQEVELYIGGTRDQYALAAYKPGTAGSILTFEFDSRVQGRWVMITRATPKDQLTLCEVLVMGSHNPVGSSFSSHEKHEGTNGTLIETSTAANRQQCCYLCMRTCGCNGAQHHSVSKECSLFASPEYMTSLDQDVAFMEPY